MKNCRTAPRFWLIVIVLVSSLSIIGCTTPPADTTNTSSTGTSTGVSGTGSSSSTGNTSTAVSTTPGGESGLTGLDGEPVAVNAGEAQQQLQSSFGITAQNTAGETLDEFRIAAGNADSSIYAKLLQIIGTLPDAFRRCTGQLFLTSSITDDEGPCLGLYDPETSKLYLTTNDPDFAGTTVHEMTHAFQNKHPDIERRWGDQFWNGNSPKSSSISDYGNTNVAEDMAESVREYWQRGAAMKSSHPDRYEFVKQFVMGGKEY